MRGDEKMLNIKELRVKAGFTQEELAEMCGVQRTTITMIEIGENNPSFELALKLSKALNCAVEDLVVK